MTTENEGGRARRFAYVDVLRFVCATSVMLFHFGFVAPIPDHDLPTSYAIWPSLTLYGQFGVHIFFVISGFVIAISIEGKSVGAFTWARFLRLYPAYWIAVTFTTALLVLDGSHRAPTLLHAAINLTMLQSYFGVPDVDGVYNTLAVELRFYLMIALLSLGRLRPTSPVLIGGWLICCAASYIVPPMFGKIVLAAWAPYFLAGMTIKSLLDSRYRWLKITLLCCAVLLEWRIVANHAGRRNAGYDTEIACFVVFGGTLLVWACAVARNPNRLIPMLTTVGAMTYPLYLFHSESGVALMRWLVPYLPIWMNIILCMILCFLLAYLISRGPEPALRNWIKAKGTSFRTKIVPVGRPTVEPQLLSSTTELARSIETNVPSPVTQQQ